MNYSLLNRISEPSTHAGLSAVLLALSFFLPQYAGIIQGMAALFGFTAVAIPEAGNKV